MALHRDIYWVGRQWAVTGYGMQAIDQKLKGQFDIEASRLWEDSLPESLNAGGWLNSEDFAKRFRSRGGDIRSRRERPRRLSRLRRAFALAHFLDGKVRLSH